MPYGCIMQIRHFQPLLNCDIIETIDGNLPRYVVECDALYRFKIDDLETTDAGYYSAAISRIDDVEPDDLPGFNPCFLAGLLGTARDAVQGILGALPPSARFHFERQHGKMPVGAYELSFWLAEFLPVGPYVAYGLLGITSVERRMEMVVAWLRKCSVTAK
jgi:Lon protease-like protein